MSVAEFPSTSLRRSLTALRQFIASSWRLAEPEGNRRRSALRVGHADDAARDLEDPPGRIAQLKDVPGIRLDGEVLVQRPDEGVLRLEDDAIVGDLRDGATGRLGQEAGAAAPAHGTVHLVEVNER